MDFRRIAILALVTFFGIAIAARGQSFSLLSPAPTNSSALTCNTTNAVSGFTNKSALEKYLPPRWIGDEQMESYSNAISSYANITNTKPPYIYGTNLIP